MAHSAQIGDRDLFLECVKESGLICAEVCSLSKDQLSRDMGIEISRELFRLCVPWDLKWYQADGVCR